MFDRDLHNYRVLPFWGWNDKLDLTELKRQIDCFAAAGCGGFFIHARVGLVTPYLSEEWMRLVKECCLYARERGMKAWLYDEDLWPSGYAGGRVPALGEEYRDRFLCLTDEVREGDEVKCVFRRGGRKYTAVRRISPAGNVRFNGQSYIDTLSERAVSAFLDSTLEAYEALFAGKMRDYVEGIFTDEPCYIMRAFAGPRAVPYSECMDELFYRSCGKVLAENIPLLFFDDGNYREIRFHYYKCLAAQFTKSYVRQYAARCAQHGILLTGHLMGEESCTTQTAWVGSAMANYPFFDVPGEDKIFRGTDDLVQYKQLTSVSEQCGKERCLCECFAGIGQECGMEGRKAIVDLQAVCGITTVNPHLSLYSMRGERKRDYPPNLFFQQPYYERESAFGEYIARMSAAAAYGRRDVRVLVIHPLSTVWSTFRPRRLERLSPAPCDRLLKDLSEKLLARGVEFHYGDETILEERATVSEGKLKIGDYVYDKVAICGSEVLFSSTLRLLSAVDKVYALSPSVRREGAEEVLLPHAEICGGTDELAAALACGEPSFYEGEGVVCSVRKGREGTLFLFVNRTREERRIRLREPLYAAVETDPVTGRRTVSDPDSLERFAPLQSKLLWLGQNTAAGRASAAGRLAADAKLCARACDLNALCLDRADYFVDGKKLFGRTHLSKIWHTSFYPLREGTPFAAEYVFEYEGGDVLFAAVENAENLDALTLNGVPLLPLRRRGEAQRCDEKAYLDPSLTRVPLKGVRKGQNMLRIEGKKRNNIAGIGMHRAADPSSAATEAEYVYIVGNFAVREGKILPAPVRMSGDVTKQGYPYYAGRLCAEFSFEFAGGRLIVEGAGGSAAAYDLYLDGEYLGCRFAPPYRWEGAAAGGTHVLRLVGYGTLFNFFGPHYLKNYRKRPWISAWDAVEPALYTEEEFFAPFSLGRLCVYETEQDGQTEQEKKE